MARNQDTFGPNGNGITAQMPNAGTLLQAQRSAAENAARMAGATCHYAMSWNRAWLNFWSNHLSQYTELPRRFADAQSNFFEQAFDHYQESIQELGGLASQMQGEAEDAMRETQDAGEQAAREFHTGARDLRKDASKQNRRKESQTGGGEERRGQQQRGGEKRGSEHQHQRGAH
jgi:hypothetical protein